MSQGFDAGGGGASSGFQSPMMDFPGHMFTMGHFLQPIISAPGHSVMP